MREDLHQEKERLTKRLKLLNVNSVGRDRILQRLEMIEEELKRAGNKAV